MANELHTPALSDALVILGAAGIVIPLFARFRITPVIGFILTGVLVGPYGLGMLVDRVPWLYNVTISDPHGLEYFAEFGIILLLFSVGLELSFNRLWAMRRQVFGLGALELFVIALVLGGMLVGTGQHWSGGLALGLALAMSSTALVLPIAGTRTAVGKAALSMLLFEDIALVPIIFLLGAMAPSAQGGFAGLMTTLWQGVLAVAVLMVAGRFALPRLFAQAARTKSPELFLSASLLVVIVAALATSSVGLSPIVGALIAGLLIAETEYHGEVERMTEPFKGLALGVFLITVGMSIDLRVILRDIWPILLAVAGVLLVKALVTGLALRLVGARRGTALETGVLMASPSETTLVVLSAASSATLIDAQTAQFWQIVTAIGLTITPALAWAGKRLARQVDEAMPAPLPTPAVEEQAHAIILGFGRVGRLVADMLRVHGKPFVAIDSDADLIASGLREGYPVIFGDATQPQALSRLGLDKANAVILTMDEPILAQRLVKKLRTKAPDLPIIARARDTHHAAALYRAGASVAVPETLESSLQLSESVLVDLGVPMGPVIASIHEKRDELRQQIKEEGGLEEKPQLRTTVLRDRVG